MNAIVSFFLSLFCIFSGITGAFVRTGSPKAVSDDFVPVLRFMAASDIHIHDLGDKKCMRLIKGIRSAYKIAESDPDYTALDAVCLTGDVTDNGRKDQYLALASILRNEIKGKTQPMIVQAKSHDCNTLGREALDYLSGITGQPNDYHYTVNGFHFIGTSASHDPDVHYDDKQLSRLDELLSAATAEDPDKPVFVFQHEHIKDTVFGSYDEDGWGVNYFNDILNKYPQVIDISGHSKQYGRERLRQSMTEAWLITNSPSRVKEAIIRMTHARWLRCFLLRSTQTTVSS